VTDQLLIGSIPQRHHTVQEIQEPLGVTALAEEEIYPLHLQQNDWQCNAWHCILAHI